METSNSEPVLKENELEEILDEHEEMIEKLPEEPKMEEERRPAQKDPGRIYCSDKLLISQIKIMRKER